MHTNMLTFMHMLTNSHVHINTEQHLPEQTSIVTQTHSDKFTYSLSQMCMLIFIYMITFSLTLT